MNFISMDSAGGYSIGDTVVIVGKGENAHNWDFECERHIGEVYRIKEIKKVDGSEIPLATLIDDNDAELEVSYFLDEFELFGESEVYDTSDDILEVEDLLL